MLVFIVACCAVFLVGSTLGSTDFKVQKLSSQKAANSEFCTGCLLFAEVIESLIVSNMTAEEVIKVAVKLVSHWIAFLVTQLG